MKRTNVVLDEELVDKGMRITGISTRRALIDHALRELVRRGEQKRVRRWRAKIEWEGDLEKLRASRF